ERVEGCHSPPNTCWNSAKLATVTGRCTGPLRVRPTKAVTALGRRAMTGSVRVSASSRPGAPRSITDVNPRHVLVVVADSTTAPGRRRGLRESAGAAGSGSGTGGIRSRRGRSAMGIAGVAGWPRRGTGTSTRRRSGRAVRFARRAAVGIALVAGHQLVELGIRHRQVGLAVPRGACRHDVLHQARMGKHLRETIVAAIVHARVEALADAGDRQRHADRRIDQLCDTTPVDLLMKLLQIVALRAGQRGGKKPAGLLLPRTLVILQRTGCMHVEVSGFPDEHIRMIHHSDLGAV